MEFHSKERKGTFDSFVAVSKEQKKLITNAAAVAVVLDMLPLNFCDKKQGMVKFAEALVELGQSFAQSLKVNVAKALPCGNTVRSGLIQFSDELQKEFISQLSSILDLGAAVPCDGVKLDTNGKILRLRFKLFKILPHVNCSERWT